MTDVYVSKVTSAGQISIPKALRDSLGLGEDYVVIEHLGDTLLLRKVRSVKEETLAYFESEAKAKGLTREQLEKTLSRSKKKLVKELFDA